MGVKSLSVVADRRYFTSEEVLACHEAGITAFVSKTKASVAAAAAMISSTTQPTTSTAAQPESA